MKSIRNKAIFLIAFFSLTITSLSQAIPIKYEIKFDGADIGPTGTGTFFWDDTTHLISDLKWQFGAKTGGINDSKVNWNAASLGGTRSQFLFEILTLQDVHPAGCSLTSSCGASFHPGELYGFSTNHLMGFSVNGSNKQSYSFIEENVGWVARGNFSASVLNVPEPSGMLLIVFGIVACSFARRYKHY